MGLVLIRSGAVRMDTCCCRPPAMLPLLVGAIEYSVSGCSCVISFFFRCPCTSTLCWLYKICRPWFKETDKTHCTVKTYKHTAVKHIKYIKPSSQRHARIKAGMSSERLLSHTTPRHVWKPNWSTDVFLHFNTREFVSLSWSENASNVLHMTVILHLIYGTHLFPSHYITQN